MMTSTAANTDRNCNGFTLIELVMVLIILAILATAALNVVEVKVEQTRFEGAQRTTDNVRDAIFDEQLLADGRTVYSGFIVDMGRPPQTREDPLDSSTLTASELWDRQALPLYAAVEASDANITTTDDANDEDADEDPISEDTDVKLRFGWRGPYLRLASGASDLIDGFGHRLTSSTTSTALSHLRGDADAAITTAATFFYGARSFGRSNEQDPVPNTNADPYENDIPNIAAGQIPGSQHVEGTVSGTVTYHTAGVAAGDIVVQIYYPNGNKIVVQRASNEASTAGVDEIVDVTPGGATYTSFRFTFRDAAGDEMTFPVGPRILRAYYKIGDMTNEEQSAVTPFTVTAPITTQDLAIRPPPP